MQTLSPVNRATVQLFATVAIAFASAAAMASEATQFEIEPSVKTRAAVMAQMTRSPKQTAMVQVGDATVFVDATGGRSRAEVRAEAVQAARDHDFSQLYLGA
jgi:hypothetical protein